MVCKVDLLKEDLCQTHCPLSPIYCDYCETMLALPHPFSTLIRGKSERLKTRLMSGEITLLTKKFVWTYPPPKYDWNGMVFYTGCEAKRLLHLHFIFLIYNLRNLNFMSTKKKVNCENILVLIILFVLRQIYRLVAIWKDRFFEKTTICSKTLCI